MSGRMKRYYRKIYRGSMQSFLQELCDGIDAGRGRFVVTANPEIFMMGSRIPEMDRLLVSDDTVIVPDGIGIIRGGEILGFHLEERIPGVEICQALLKYADSEHRSLYLFGAKREVLERLKARIAREYPGIELCGSSDGYAPDKDRVFREIVKLDPDIVLVALGTPAQELLIRKYYDRSLKGVYIGVGGSFDVLSGMKRRAPEFFIKYNLEWLYRITTEPKRLKRFWDSNVRFLFELKKERKNGRKGKD